MRSVLGLSDRLSVFLSWTDDTPKLPPNIANSPSETLPASVGVRHTIMDTVQTFQHVKSESDFAYWWNGFGDGGS